MHGVCLVGCGRIARTHARNLDGRVELACYSRTRQSAERLAAEYPCRVIPSWEEVLRRDDVEALVLCSPPEHHCDQVVAGLQAGKTVLVEKPMCVRPEEVRRIRDAAADRPAGRLMVAENYYYKPVLERVRGILRRKVTGEPERIHVRKMFRQEAVGWKQGYGALLEGGIHFVALVSALAESCGRDAPRRVRGAFPGRGEGRPERLSRSEIDFDGGLSAVVEYAWDRRALLQGLMQHSHVRGARGRVVFESNGLYVVLLSRGRRRLYLPGFRDLMGYGAMTRDFLACLEEPEHEPVSSLQRAGRDLDIVFSAYGGP